MLRNLAIVASGVALLCLLAACSEERTEASRFCETAEGVRKANLAFAGELGQAAEWRVKQPAVTETLDELRRQLDALPAVNDHASDVRLWKADLDVLSARASESQSVDEFLYEQDSDRPAPDDLNPALERIDALFESECGFAARR